jgi:phosphopantothenoylcysteine decarboxylase/phosphopantothenate--cysteine ligase
VEPGVGHLASGASGAGRLAEYAEIIGTLSAVVGRGGDLAGRRVVVTAGGTQEPIDPVRYITNRSSGKQGYALAEAARDRGAVVTLITSADLPPPGAVTVVRVRSAIEMLDAARSAVIGADALIMAAAVADYRVEVPADRKIKKEAGGPPAIALVENPDILKSIEGPAVRVGFAAETDDLLRHAARKLETKRLHLIVANDVSQPDAGFAVDTNRVHLLRAGRPPRALPLASKREVADSVLDEVAALLRGR